MTAFTTASQLPLFWNASNQSMPPQMISCTLFLIISSPITLGFGSCHFILNSHAKTSYAPIHSPKRATFQPISPSVSVHPCKIY